MPGTINANDILLLVVESENQAISLTTANGFAQMTGSPQSAGTAATDPGHRLAVFWKRAVGGDAAPVVADSGDHNTCAVFQFRGVVATGNPWDVTAAGNDGAVNDLSGAIPGATTTVANTFLALLEGTSFNGNSAANCSGWAGTGLTITEQFDSTNTSGLGGGFCMATAAFAGPGAYPQVTVNLASTTFKGAFSIALKPAILVTGVTVNPTTATILEGGTQTISATALPAGADNRNVNWTKVSGCDASDAVAPTPTLGDGAATTTFTAAAGGTLPRTCVVRATAADGSGFSADSSITVNPNNLITIGNGSDPGGSTITQTQVGPIDAFTVQANPGPASINSVTVNLTAGNAGLTHLFIDTSSACTTSIGSLLGPVAGNNIVGLSTNIDATSTSGTVNYYVCGRGAAVPSNTQVQGNVSSVTAVGYSSTDLDNGNATLTVRPANVTIGNGTPEAGTAQVVAGQVGPIDAFQLQAEVGSASVSAVTVNLATGASSLTSLFVSVSGACTAPLGSLAGPALGNNVIPISPNIVATTAQSANYYVCGTASATVGSATGNVASVTAANFTSIDSDTTNGTLLVTAFTPEGDTTDGSTKPVVAIINPMDGAVLTLPARIQVRAFSPVAGGAFSPADTVTLVVNGSAQVLGAAQRSVNYGPQTTGPWSGVWEYTIPAGAYPAGSTVTLRANATNALGGGPLHSRQLTVTISTARGDGNLLVRDNASQLCSDCHGGVMTHSSETTTNALGVWSTTCRDCHTPHTTTNLGLINTQIKPPELTGPETPRAVVFQNRNGYVAGGMASPANNGVCQVCHTQTKYYRQDGTLATHETGKNCASCHDHKSGLKANCTTCHGMEKRGATVVGADSGIDAAPPALATPTPNGQVTLGNNHLVHLDQASFRTNPIQCADCHLTKAHADGWSDVAWGTLATSNGFSPTPATGRVSTAGWPATPTCTNWCHGQGLAGGGGPSSFNWTSTAALGCSSCHGAPPPVDATAAADHPQSIFCSSCHGAGYIPMNLSPEAKDAHINGVVNKPADGCTACHGELAGLAGAAVDRTSATAAPGYSATAVDTVGNTSRASVKVGGHIRHVNASQMTMMSAKSCGVCHTWPANGDTTHADAALDMAWTSPANAVTTTPTYAGGSCTNYCHSNAKPLGGTPSAPGFSWTSTTQMLCTDCHATGVYGGTGLSAKHQRHVATYGYGCVACHVNSAASNASIVAGGGQHVDGTRDVDFDSSGANNSLGSYDYGTYQCSNTYCHSNGVDRVAPFVSGPSVAWNGTTTCSSCHNAGTAMATYAHQAHVNQAATYGTTYGCQTCHYPTTQDGSTVSSPANHVNALSNVDGNPSGGLKYQDGANTVANSCSTYCHSSGQGGAATPQFYSDMSWTATTLSGCSSCHGRYSPADPGFLTSYGAPNYVNGGNAAATANSHKKHVSSAADCYICHKATSNVTGDAIVAGTTHTDGNRQVSFDATEAGASATYSNDANKRCNSVTCHGAGQPQWGGSVTCSDCHLRTTLNGGDLNDFTGIANKTAALVNSDEWAAVGHGQSTAAYSEFTGTTNRCVYCHDDQNASANHNQAGNPFRLRGKAAAGGATAAYSTADLTLTNAVCLNCHDLAANNPAGVDPDGAGGQAVVGPATSRISAYHAGGKHVGDDGGERCWDCHDPHGDGGNIKMIGADVLRYSSDPSGYAGGRAAQPVTFTTQAVGGYTDQVGPTYNGVCQVCHNATDHLGAATSMAYWLANGTGVHNETQDCVGCHTHQQPPNNAFQGAGACTACHMGAASAATNTDRDEFPPDTTLGGKSLVDPEDWLSTGHGNMTTYSQSGLPGAKLPAPTSTVEPCYYCHAPDTALVAGGKTSKHTDVAAGNPFRLNLFDADTSGTAGDSILDKNYVCLVCHQSGSPGFDPDGGANATYTSRNRTTSQAISATHYGAKHDATHDGGTLCWDCHDPHGDWNYNAGVNRAIAYMVQFQPTIDSSNAWGSAGTFVSAANGVDFNMAKAGVNTTLEGSDYVATASPFNGVCQVCHTNTVAPGPVTHWTASGGGTGHQNGTARCVACHDHQQPATNAFLNVPATNCTGCHNSPPAETYGRHLVHVQAIAASPAYGSTTNVPNATQYGFQCGMCHTTTSTNHMNDQGGTAADAYNVNTAFTWGSVLTYTQGATPLLDTHSATGLVYKNTNGSCSAVYCHDPQGATYNANKAVTWTDAAGTLLCTDCHDDAFNLASTVLPGAHGAHSLATASGGYTYSCELCHANTVSSASAVSNKTFHVNNNKDDVKFTSVGGLDQSPGTFSGGLAGTCSNTYCHSNGQDLVAPFVSGPSIAWNTTKSCTSCHGGGGAATTTLSDSHHAHVDATANDGYNHQCDQCHNNTGNNSSITNKANHVDADANHDVAFNAVPMTQTAGTYDPAGKTCSNTYCHSNGQDTVAPFVSGPSAAWGGTAGCTSCHDGGGAASTTLAGSHGKHVNTGYAYACDRCHNSTGNSTAITNKANHVDADTTTHDVVFNTLPLDQSAGTYAVAGLTCSNTYCHSNGQDRTAPFVSGPSIAWGTAADVQCDSCHGGNASATAVTGVGPMASNDHAMHMNQAAYLGTNFECSECHNATVSAGNDRAITGLSNHVNGAENVSMINGGTYSGSATKQCSSTYCHSNGTETPDNYVTMDWDLGTSLTNDCKQCHGREASPAFTSQYGEPNYTNINTANDTRNSHDAHVSPVLATAKTECANCHLGTIDATGALKTGGLHLNKLVEISGASITSYTDASETCNTVTCHGGGSPQWGTTLDCTACHLGAVSATTETEQDDYNYGNGTFARIDPEDWINYGHGRPLASGVYDSGNPAAGFDTAIGASTDDGCKYCHDKTAPHGQFGVSTNPFRLANIGAGNTAALKNGVCTKCHDGNVTGYLGKVATKIVTASHYGAQHVSDSTFGGQLCWDCHDPHGDYRYTSANGGASETPLVTANEILGHMIDAKLAATHPTAEGNTTEWGTNGTTGPTLAAKSPRFNKSLVAPTTSYDWGDYALSAVAPFSYNGVCQACHTGTTRFLATGTTWATDSNHNNTQGCTVTCHKHDQPPADAFKGDLGNCRGCHGTGTQGTTPVRRAVDADFTSRNSHHVGAGSASMGGTLTNWDCIVCHAEGTAAGKGGTISGNSTLHGNKRIDLRDADSATGAYFQYDADTVRALTAANANSVTASWKQEMSGRADDLVGAPTVACNPLGTGCSKGLDRFCISCHDADGASQSQNVGESASATALNPFADTAISNENDQVNRTRVVDIASRVHETARKSDGTSYAALNRDYTAGTAAGYTARRVDAGTVRNDPPEGVFSRHAIRGLSVSVYGATNTNWDGATPTAGTDGTYWDRTAPNIAWSSTSVMSCADCHTTDGNNTTNGNAHGSLTEYMLKNNAGTAGAESATAATYVCAKCHLPGYYDGGNAKHTNSGSDWVDTTAATGAARNNSASQGNVFGLACGNCHGGGMASRTGFTAPQADVQALGGFGTIHGTSQVLGYTTTGTAYNGGTSGYRPAYRFTNGSSMRYYDPGDWTTAATRSCYTLQATTSDAWGGCSKHDGGTGNNIEVNSQRPLDY